MPHAKKSSHAKSALPRVAYTVAEFCEAHRLSQAMYYKLRGMGLGPVEMKAGTKTLIGLESAADWRREREVPKAEAATAAA